jgi:cephalosporin-C deacetylase-like acetyl esterase
MMGARLGCSLLAALCCISSGCGSFVARRLVQAPNTYPSWMRPQASVELGFVSDILTNLPSQYVTIGPPPARLHYRLLEPGNYQTKAASTNWMEQGRMHFRFDFSFILPNATSPRTNNPAGTVVLLHGYGIDQLSMVPWAFRLAQENWRCILVDLRGHGKSTGNRIFFGVRETQDLTRLLNELAQRGLVSLPVVAMGESYGAAVALRWKLEEPRIQSVVAISPYPKLTPAILNIRRHYASWIPENCLEAGLNRLPALLGTNAASLDPINLMQGHPLDALYVAGGLDCVVPPDEVWRLRAASSEQSQCVLVSRATHESLPFFFTELEHQVVQWLNKTSASAASD